MAMQITYNIGSRDGTPAAGGIRNSVRAKANDAGVPAGH